MNISRVWVFVKDIYKSLYLDIIKEIIENIRGIVFLDFVIQRDKIKNIAKIISIFRLDNDNVVTSLWLSDLEQLYSIKRYVKPFNVINLLCYDIPDYSIDIFSGKKIFYVLCKYKKTLPRKKNFVLMNPLLWEIINNFIQFGKGDISTNFMEEKFPLEKNIIISHIPVSNQKKMYSKYGIYNPFE